MKIFNIATNIFITIQVYSNWLQFRNNWKIIAVARLWDKKHIDVRENFAYAVLIKVKWSIEGHSNHANDNKN